MTTDTEPKAPATPPYISFKSLTNLLDRLHETHLPPRIDRSYLAGLSGGYQTQVMAALRWLDLIGEKGDVTGALTALAENPEQRPRVVGELLRSHYPAVFALSSKNATQGQLEEEFRSFGISGSTLRSAIAFFLHAAAFAEIPVSPHFKIPPVRTGNGKPTTRKTKPAAPKAGSRGGQSDTADQSQPSGGDADLRTRYVEMLLDKAQAQEAMDGELLDRIETLLGYGTEPKE